MGASVNSFICQFLSDITRANVHRPQVFETTALGAAYLAGLAVGVWENQGEIQQKWETDQTYRPLLPETRQKSLYEGWQRAVQCARGWVSDDQ